MEKNEKKTVKVELIIIIVLAICLVFAGGFIIYDKFIKEDAAIVEDNNEKDNENNKVEITTEIDAKVTNLTSLEGYAVGKSVRNTNIFDDAYTRLDYVTYTIQFIEKSCKWTSGIISQDVPYVAFDDYKQKYNNIYGKQYSFFDDMKQENIGMVANTDCGNMDQELNDGGSYICWMGTRGITGDTLKLTIVDKKLEDNIYILTGTYNLSNSESGTFEIKYVIEDNEAYLNSFIMRTTE